MSDIKSSNGSSSKRNKGCLVIGSIGCLLIIILLGLIVGLIVFAFSSGSALISGGESVLKEGKADKKIALIRIDGMITESSSYDYYSGSSGASSEHVNSQIDQALTDDSVAAILLKMNTPGGETVATDLIYKKVLSADSQKPVITWMSGMGASGGYYIACGSRYIMAHPETLTGSIGAILEITNLEGLYNMLGIETRTFKAGEYKDGSGLFDEDDEGEEDKIIQDLVDESYDNFYSIVKSERGLSDSKMSEFADGRVISGASALEYGLVDELGDYDDAINEIEEIVGIDNMTIVEYNAGGFWDTLYSYQSSILNKIGISQDKVDLGAKMY